MSSLLLAFAAPSASAKACPKPDRSSALKAFGGVKCGKAKKVVHRYLTGRASQPSGFTCADVIDDKGTSTTCTKGAKRIQYYEAE